MAYRESVCTDMDQVPGLVASFAASMGWNVQQDGSARVLRRPVGEGAPGVATPIKLEVVKSTYSSTNYEAVAISRQGLAPFSANAIAAIRQQFALVRSPWLSSGQRQPVIPKPTKLHSFGGALPEPFLAFVIEYGFNVYRCFYIGTLDGPSLGTGEVISCSTGTCAGNINWFDASTNTWNAMFSSRVQNGESNGNLAGSHGGVFIQGFEGGIAEGFTRFNQGDYADPGVNTANLTRGVWGGPRDGVDDALVSHGFSAFSGDVLLTPINLYTILGTGSEGRAAPLGSIRGVRSVNMRDLEPGASFELGNKLWRVFPHLRKNTDAVTRAGVPDAASTSSTRACYAREDTSWYWGLAFLEGDAV